MQMDWPLDTKHAVLPAAILLNFACTCQSMLQLLHVGHTTFIAIVQMQVSLHNGMTACLDASGTLLFSAPGSSAWQAVLPDSTYCQFSATTQGSVWLPDGSQLEVNAPHSSSDAADGQPSSEQAQHWIATSAAGTQHQILLGSSADGQEANSAAEAGQQSADAGSTSPPAEAQSDSNAPGHTGTTNSTTGPQYQISRAIDPDTGAVVISRGNMSQRIEYQTGDALELHPDGSRLTMFASGEWLLEAPQLPAVRGSSEGIACAVQADAVLCWHADSGNMDLQQDDGLHLAISGTSVLCGAKLDASFRRAGPVEYVCLLAVHSHLPSCGHGILLHLLVEGRSCVCAVQIWMGLQLAMMQALAGHASGMHPPAAKRWLPPSRVAWRAFLKAAPAAYGAQLAMVQALRQRWA